MLLVVLLVTAWGVLLFLIAVSLLIRRWLLVVIVEQQSMLPALAPGDRLLAARRWPTQWLRKGQIVLVWPVQPSAAHLTRLKETPYIKRIVAVGGETYQPDDQAGQAWPIPAGSLFVRGDHHGHSVDSLVWGPLPVQNVAGVVLMRLPRKALAPAPTGSPRQNVTPQEREGRP